MKVLLTGGAGFIGRHLADRLVGAGHDVVALDSLLPLVHADPVASRAAFPGTLVEGDVADPDAWAGLDEVDALVHLAAETGTAQSMYEVERYHRANVEGTRRAGRWAAARGIPVVSMSSRAVYGEGAHDCRTHGRTVGAACCDRAAAVASVESDPHRPVSVYGETKSLGEAALLAEVDDSVPVTIIRPQNVIGPGQSLHNPYTGVLAAFLAMLREGRPLTVHGDGSQTRDFVHVADLAELLAWTVENPCGTRVLNAGTGVRTTLLELATWAAEGVPTEGSHEPRAVEVVHVDVHRAGDITDACADLGLLRSIGAPLPGRTTRGAVHDFIAWSWDKPGARAHVWASALAELADRGLTS